jgi:glycosyltransferase involved in cell wall biosynthesis
VVEPVDELSDAQSGRATARKQRRRSGHICQVVHGLTVGGAERLAATLGRFASARHRVSFVCLDELGELGEVLRQDGYRVEVLDRGAGVSLSCARRLSRYFREESVDLAHAHQYTPFFYSLAARGPRRGPPVIFTEHGRWHPDYPRRKRMLFNRIFLSKRDRLVGVGEAVRQALIVNEGLPAQRVEVIYNGVDLSRFDFVEGRRQRARATLELGPEKLAILQVARLDHLKDHGTALKTMRRVVNELPDARLLLVGDGPERGVIENMIGELNLAPQVRLLGTRHDIPELLAAADLFLLTSISEGIPLTLIEAQAAGTPVVSTAVGGVAEIVPPAHAMLAPAGDDAELARHVLELARHPAQRAQMAEKGRERARALFSEEQMLASYERLYSELLT